MPRFSLTDQHGNRFRSDDHKGKKMVIYFYPKDESAVCTKEACAFRDSFTEFTDLGVLVIGINSASVESHAKFSVKNRLPFTLLSDPGNAVLKSFGIKPALFITGRETFVINDAGVIVFKFRAFFDGTGHPAQVLEFLKSGRQQGQSTGSMASDYAIVGVVK